MMEKKHKPLFVQGAISAQYIADNIAKHSTNTSIGAHSIFLGQIRADVVDNKRVKSISYTAYEAMALETMHKIREDIFSKFNLTCAHTYHSLGNVAVGEISMFVFTSSVHRLDAINACHEFVERIKKELPIWGKEIFEDDTETWKINR